MDPDQPDPVPEHGHDLHHHLLAVAFDEEGDLFFGVLVKVARKLVPGGDLHPVELEHPVVQFQPGCVRRGAFHYLPDPRLVHALGDPGRKKPEQHGPRQEEVGRRSRQDHRRPLPGGLGLVGARVRVGVLLERIHPLDLYEPAEGNHTDLVHDAGLPGGPLDDGMKEADGVADDFHPRPARHPEMPRFVNRDEYADNQDCYQDVHGGVLTVIA